MSVRSLPGKERGFTLGVPPSVLAVTVAASQSQADHAPCVQARRPGVEPQTHGSVTFSGAHAAAVVVVPPPVPGSSPLG